MTNNLSRIDKELTKNQLWINKEWGKNLRIDQEFAKNRLRIDQDSIKNWSRTVQELTKNQLWINKQLGKNLRIDQKLIYKAQNRAWRKKKCDEVATLLGTKLMHESEQFVIHSTLKQGWELRLLGRSACNYKRDVVHHYMLPSDFWWLGGNINSLHFTVL